VELHRGAKVLDLLAEGVRQSRESTRTASGRSSKLPLPGMSGRSAFGSLSSWPPRSLRRESARRCPCVARQLRA